MEVVLVICSRFGQDEGKKAVMNKHTLELRIAVSKAVEQMGCHLCSVGPD